MAQRCGIALPPFYPIIPKHLPIFPIGIKWPCLHKKIAVHGPN
jgi:hypothetical protein